MYQLGRLWGSMSGRARFFLCFAIVATVFGVNACSDAEERASLQQTIAIRKALDADAARNREAAEKARVVMCQTEVPVLMEKAKSLFSSGDVHGAHQAMNACSGYLSDKTALALAKKYLNTYSDQLAKDSARQAAAERARKKGEGVSVGMTKADVLASNWGKPKSINATTTARGNKEQWVYRDNNYLYFQGEILTTIQH